MSTKRDVGFLEWSDPRGWMEAMRGPRWKTLVRQENQRFNAAVAAAAGGRGENLEAAVAAFETARIEADLAGEWRLHLKGRGELLLRPQPGGTVAWAIQRPGEVETAAGFHMAGDVDLAAAKSNAIDLLVYTVDTKAGGRHYEVIVLDLAKGIPLWTYSCKGGGLESTVAVIGGRVYCLEADSPLRYKRLVSFELETGAGRRVEYEEKDATAVLEIVKGEAGCLFLLIDTAGKKRLYHVGEKGVNLLTKKGEDCVFPVGYGGPNRSEPCYFIRSHGLRGRWIPRGEALQRLFKRALPSSLQGSEDYGLDAVILAGAGAIVTRVHGKRALWIGSVRGDKPSHQWFGEIEFHPWTTWMGGEAPTPFLLHRPGSMPQRGELAANGKIVLEGGSRPYAPGTRHGYARSADGEAVRWVLCGETGKRCKGLIVVVYGAYGLPTHMMTSRWKPYLEKGIAVGFACVRGGGDHTELWAAAGQVAGKVQGIEDFEACIYEMERLIEREGGSLSKRKIAAFGRSAGGYIVGAAAARPGRRFGIAYTEVPYVDVLRTASNPALPLTEFEYKEFGDPAHSIADFELLLRLSPVEAALTAAAGSLDDLLVVCRTSENDRQVYAYESLKWIGALRERSGRGAAIEKKVVSIRSGEGHFSFGGAASVQRAEDYLLISEKILKNG
jgi:hypothetical protein